MRRQRRIRVSRAAAGAKRKRSSNRRGGPGVLAIAISGASSARRQSTLSLPSQTCRSARTSAGQRGKTVAGVSAADPPSVQRTRTAMSGPPSLATGAGNWFSTYRANGPCSVSTSTDTPPSSTRRRVITPPPTPGGSFGVVSRPRRRYAIKIRRAASLYAGRDLQHHRVDAEAADRDLPHRLRRRREHELGVRRSGQPGRGGQLLVELSRAPAGVAEEEAGPLPGHLRRVGLEDATQDLDRGGQVEPLGDLLAVLDARIVPEEEEPALRLDGPARPQHEPAIAADRRAP